MIARPGAMLAGRRRGVHPLVRGHPRRCADHHRVQPQPATAAAAGRAEGDLDGGGAAIMTDSRPPPIGIHYINTERVRWNGTATLSEDRDADIVVVVGQPVPHQDLRAPRCLRWQRPHPQPC